MRTRTLVIGGICGSVLLAVALTNPLVPIHCSRRRKATTLTLGGIEGLLSRWTEPKACAPARLPWQAGVVAQNIAAP